MIPPLPSSPAATSTEHIPEAQISAPNWRLLAPVFLPWTASTLKQHTHRVLGAPYMQPSTQGFPALSEVVQSCKWWDSRSANRLSPNQLSGCVSTASQQADVLLAQQCGEGGARPARGDRAGGAQCLDTLTRNKSSCVLPVGCQKQSETRE